VPFNIVGSLWKARTLLKQFSPHLVVGTGGYVSWPVLRAASSRGIPTALQEQNSFPGITTRQLAPRANRIYLGFGKAQEYFKTSAKCSSPAIRCVPTSRARAGRKHSNTSSSTK